MPRPYILLKPGEDPLDDVTEYPRQRGRGYGWVALLLVMGVGWVIWGQTSRQAEPELIPTVAMLPSATITRTAEPTRPATATRTDEPTRAPSATPSQTPSATPSPTITPTPTATLTPLPTLTPTPDQLAGRVAGYSSCNLRYGPGMNYPIGGIAHEGDALRLMGRDAGARWYYLGQLWISASCVTLAGPEGDLVHLSMITPLPPPR